MKIKSNIKAGGGLPALLSNHNEKQSSGLKIKSKVKAGGSFPIIAMNHNEKQVGAR